ncbi:right-handed parallel beta-helix repeat-containing protein [Halomontanus rarus]|uniref:right-handed parallel beta-helix repeat-containing protein n=1 Tax=Halomontanus rarus TaxID=3034020 RepID=UPI001A9869E1
MLVLTTVLLGGVILLGGLGAGSVVGASGATELDSCASISTSGAYVLTNDVTNGGVPECLYVDSSDVLIDGNGYVVDGESPSGTGILIHGPNGAVDNVTVTNVTLENWDVGVEIRGTANATVEDLTIRDVNTGIVADTVGDDLRVAGTNITRVSGDGIRVTDSIRVDVLDNVISDVGSSADDAAIVLDDATGRVQYNDISNVTGTGVAAAGWNWPGARIRDNDVANASEHGINVSSGGGLNVIGNTVDGVGKTGIQIVDTGGLRVNRNAVANVNASAGTWSGVRIDNARESTSIEANDVVVGGESAAFEVSNSDVSFEGDDLRGRDAIDLSYSSADLTDVRLRGRVGIEAQGSTLDVTGLDYVGGNGLRLYGGETTVTDSTIDASAPVYTYRDDVTLENVTILGSRSGVTLHAESIGTVANSTIRTNPVYAGTEGVHVREGSEASVAGTELHNASVALEIESNTNTTVTDTLFESVGRGVNVTGGNVTMANVTQNGGGFAVYADDSQLEIADLAADVSAGFRLEHSTLALERADLDVYSSGIYAFYSDATLDDVSISGGRDGIESDADSTVVATDVHIDATELGLWADRDGSIHFENGSVNSDDVAVLACRGDSAVSIFRSIVVAPVGVELDETVPAANSEVTFTDLSETNVSIRNDGVGGLEARMNYYGPRGPTATEGEVLFASPFLTAPPQAVNPAELQEFAVELEMPAGEVYTLGAPGGLERPLAEVFDEFEGAVYRYDGDAGEWTLADGTERLDALEAVVVVPETDTRAVVEFREATPAEPTQRTLEPGWRFVTPRSYGAAEQAFHVSKTLEATDLLHLYALPDSPLDVPYDASDFAFTSYEFQDSTYGDIDGPTRTVSPFAGYFVYVTEESTVPARVPDGVTYPEFEEILTMDGYLGGLEAR